MKLSKLAVASLLGLSVSLSATAKTTKAPAQVVKTATATQKNEPSEAELALKFVNNVCSLASDGSMYVADLHQQGKSKADAKKDVDGKIAELKKQMSEDPEIASYITAFWQAALDGVYAQKVLPQDQKGAFVQSTGYEAYYVCMQTSINND